MTFEEWLKSFPWLHERDLPCIISADLDGIACGLLQQQVLGWNVVGTYDGAALCLYQSPDQVDWDRVVFIDLEIFRPAVRSIGNHLFAFDAGDVARLRATFPHCVSPNLWREITVRDSFQRKYPFSTLPLLLASHTVRDSEFDIGRAWLALTLHTDSSFTNAATYQENALDWLEAMGAGATSDGLKRFCRLLERITAKQAVALLNEVQRWASDADFGAKQRACRFDCQILHERERVMKLIDRIRAETAVATTLPFAAPPAHCETLATQKFALPSGSMKRQAKSFADARALSGVSMAATGRTAEGLSVTIPSPQSLIEFLRP